MKKILIGILSFVLILGAMVGCASKEAKFIDKWINVNDGDVYVFEKGGKGNHNGINITFSAESNNSLTVTEGAGNVQTKSFSLEIGENFDRIIPNDENTFYVREKDYESVSEQVKNENIQILKSVEFWKALKATNYISFYVDYIGKEQNGYGWFLVTDYTTTLEWEMIDNNTVKLSVDYNGGYTLNLDIVNNNGEYQLQNSQGEVMYVPKK